MQNLQLVGCEQTPAFAEGSRGWGGSGPLGRGVVSLPRQGLVRQTGGRTLFLVGLEPSPFICLG